MLEFCEFPKKKNRETHAYIRENQIYESISCFFRDWGKITAMPILQGKLSPIFKGTAKILQFSHAVHRRVLVQIRRRLFQQYPNYGFVWRHRQRLW